MAKLRGQMILGREEFVRNLKQKISGNASSGEQPSMKVLEAASPGQNIKKVSQELKIKTEELVGKPPGVAETTRLREDPIKIF